MSENKKVVKLDRPSDLHEEFFKVDRSETYDYETCGHIFKVVHFDLEHHTPALAEHLDKVGLGKHKRPKDDKHASKMAEFDRRVFEQVVKYCCDWIIKEWSVVREGQAPLLGYIETRPGEAEKLTKHDLIKFFLSDTGKRRWFDSVLSQAMNEENFKYSGFDEDFTNK